MPTGRDSVVGIATRYRLNGQGIESLWLRYFPHPPRPALGPIQPPVTGHRVSFPRVERPGSSVDHPPPPSSAEVKEKVELYLYYPSRAFMASSRVYFTFTYLTALRRSKKNSVALVREELYQQSGRRRSAKLVPTFADRQVSRGQRNGSPWPLISVFWTGAATFLFK